MCSGKSSLKGTDDTIKLNNILILFLSRYLYFYYKTIWCRIVVCRRNGDIYSWFFYEWIIFLKIRKFDLNICICEEKRVLLLQLIMIFYLKG